MRETTARFITFPKYKTEVKEVFCMPVDFVSFHSLLNNKSIYSPTCDEWIHRICAPFLVVEECVRQLVAGGFTELKEKDTWKIQPLGKVH